MSCCSLRFFLQSYGIPFNFYDLFITIHDFISVGGCSFRFHECDGEETKHELFFDSEHKHQLQEVMLLQLLIYSTLFY